MSPTADGEDFMDEIRCGQDLLHVIVRTGWVSGRIVFSISRVTIAELHHDEELRRREFPVTGEKVFVAHAGICPIPRRVSEAIRDYAEQSTRGDQETLVPAFQMHRTRELAANLIGAEIGEVAFVGPTSLALSLVACGLSFEPGDTVLVYLDDFPSNVYPWLALAERGVEVKFLKVEKLGGIHLEDVLNQVDDRTRLVALASCHFASGFRIDVDAIGKALRERGILFCLDAIQTVGAFPTSIKHVDFLAADAHKWMLGPCTAGIMYVRKELQDQLRPPIHGWHNLRCPDFVALDELEFQPDARRYEVGSANLLGLVGLHAAFELMAEIGVDNIGCELLRKRAWMTPALQAKGYSVLHAEASEANSSGIVTIVREGEDIVALHAKLEAAKVMSSVRSDRSGGKYLRFSPHYYNTDEEMNRILELL